MSHSRTKTNAMLCLLAVGVFVAVGGCEQSYDSKVTGHVTLDGELLRSGTVVYYPEEGGVPAAYSEIQRDGSYWLRTGMGNPGKEGAGGLVSGDYVVTVIAHGPVARGIGEYGGPPDPGPLLTPSKYGDAETTDLRFTVNAGRNVIPLPLVRDEADAIEIDGEEETETDSESDPPVENNEESARENVTGEEPEIPQDQESGDGTGEEVEEAGATAEEDETPQTAKR